MVIGGKQKRPKNKRFIEKNIENMRMESILE